MISSLIIRLGGVEKWKIRETSVRIDQLSAVLYVSLELLEKTFLLFGLAKDDDELTKVISNFIVPVIMKMTSPYESVQKKVRLNIINSVIWFRLWNY